MAEERIGDYVLERELGAGGMAKVYRARHVVLETHHAIKVLDPTYRANADARQRFLDEARIQAKHLDHPNVVKVTNIIATPEHAALVMELVEGSSLEAELPTLRERPAELVQIALGILAGVGHAHAASIIHRDLKPANVLLAKRGGTLVPKVSDFGIAKLATPAQADKKSTNADARMGTLSYMSPEQVRGAKNVTPRSDIFSIGSMLFELATGALPFAGDSDYDLMDAIIKGTRKRVVDLAPATDKTLATVIEKALEVEPDKRFASCDEMATALRASAALGAESSNAKHAAGKASATDTTPGSVATPASTAVEPAKSRFGLAHGLVAIGLGLGAIAVALVVTRRGSGTTTTRDAGVKVVEAMPIDAGLDASAHAAPPTSLTAPIDSIAEAVTTWRYVVLVDGHGGKAAQANIEVQVTEWSDGEQIIAPKTRVVVGSDLATGQWELISHFEIGTTIRAWIPTSIEILDAQGTSVKRSVMVADFTLRARTRAPGKWCVGGFNGVDPSTGKAFGHACETMVSDRNWHWHNEAYVAKASGPCFTCWDEADAACDSIVPDRGYTVLSKVECLKRGHGDRVEENWILRRVPNPAPAPPPQLPQGAR